MFNEVKASIFEPVKKHSSFYERVYEVARMIPYGRVTSYGAIAKHLGSRQSARMVGWAMNNSSAAMLPVPAHRVLNRNGMLTGKHHFGSPTLMQQLLESEGIRVEDDCVIDFEKVFWEPKKIQRSKLKVQRRKLSR
jgi:methylated-DNA-protein-cysteine methyltransferase-like protein